MNIKKLRELKKNKKGFTLIEIIVVIVILAVLLAVAVPSVLNYVNEADSAKLMANSRAVMTTAQAEVVKQQVSADKLTADELTALLGPNPAEGATNGIIAKQSGVTVNVTALYSGDVTVTEGAGGTLSVSGGANLSTSLTKDLTAVAMTIDGKEIVAVINDKIYVQK